MAAMSAPEDYDNMISYWIGVLYYTTDLEARELIKILIERLRHG